MKKFTTLLLTGAMVASMSVSAFADMEISADNAHAELTIDGAQAIIDLNASGFTFEQLNDGFTLDINLSSDPTSGFGGGVMFNSKSSGWVQTEDYYWCDPSGDKNIVVTDHGDNNYTLSIEVPRDTFTADDFNVDAEGYAQIFIQQWWGDSNAVISIEGYSGPTGYPIGFEKGEFDEDGNAIVPGADESAETADLAPIAFLASMMAVAGIALVASKKRA